MNWLLINERILLCLLAIFGVITIDRRRFEVENLLWNVAITFVVWYGFIFSMVMIIIFGALP